MKSKRFRAIEGGCTCGSVRYRLVAAPLFVHCCHCRWCQRETGSAFVLNALVEANQVKLLSGRVVGSRRLGWKERKFLFPSAFPGSHISAIPAARPTP